MADQGTEGLLSPFLRNQRQRAARTFLRGRVLDYGCGGGALARYCPAELYLGIDRDAIALEQARRQFPDHRFEYEVPAGCQFDTVVALAVIEHVKNPGKWLGELKDLLAEDGCVVLTTPHPLFRKVHDIGAAIGIFSREASSEHESFLNKHDLSVLATGVGMNLIYYHRFLGFANQLAVLS